jgi:ABC-type multidrug transport system fused ATPase/permease subunit
MSRQLLNHVPDWVLVIVFIGVAVILTLAGIWLVRRFVPQWRDEDSSDKTVGVMAMVMTFFALVLAFVVVNLYSGYENASNNVGAEANSLSSVLTDVHSFAPAQRQLMNAALARYVREVRSREFALLRDGHADPRAQGYLNAIIETLQRYSPKGETQVAFYRTTSDDLEKLAEERNNRVDAASATIPGPLLGLLILLALLTLLTTILLRTRSFGLDLILCLSIAVTVGAGMVTAAILEYPFSGSIAVSSAPFDRADLNQVLQANP